MNEKQHNAVRLAAILEEDDAPIPPNTNGKANGHAAICTWCNKHPQSHGEMCGSCWTYSQTGVKPKPVEAESVLSTPVTNLCRKCKKNPSRPDAPYCNDCFKKVTPKAKRRYLGMSKPQCEECGKNPVLGGEKLCYHCAHHGKTKLKKPTALEFPESCMYGWLGWFARQIDAPPSAAYPIVLGLGAGYGVPQHKRLRTNLFVNIVGVKGSGKTRVMDNAQEAWLAPPEIGVIKKYPGSEVGLIQLLGGKKAKDMRPEDYYPKPYLLVQDEMRITFNKMDIKGSSLPNMLNDMFYHDEFGTASKQGHWECCARLSLVGGLTCESANEFAEIFGAATTQGTYDRMIFGTMPGDWEFDDAWEPPKEADGTEIRRRAKTCAIPYEIYEAVNVWRRKDFENRKRLGELVLRVALITASMNHDSDVTPECLRCAIEFIEWQDKLRHHYAPSETDDLDGKAERAVLRALEKYEGWVSWRTLTTKHSLYKAAKSPTRLNRVKQSLVREFLIEEEYDENSEGKRERTGRVRLVDAPYQRETNTPPTNREKRG